MQYTRRARNLYQTFDRAPETGRICLKPPKRAETPLPTVGFTE
jgi:hypothetical protein